MPQRNRPSQSRARTILSLVQAASRIAWGPFYISHTADAEWSVYDTRAIRGRGLLASNMPFGKAAQYAFNRMQGEDAIEPRHPRV